MKTTFLLILISFSLFKLNAQCTIVRAPYKTLVIPGTIEMEDYDMGCPDVSYHTKNTINYGGQYRNDDVGIEVTSDVGGGYDVGWINTGDWYEYTVNVNSKGSYNFNMRIASPSSTNKFHIEIDGVDVTGPIIPPLTAGIQVWTSVNKTIALPAGKHIMRIAIDNAAGALNLNKFIITSNDIVWHFETTLESWTLTNNLSGSVAASILTLTNNGGSNQYIQSPDSLNLYASIAKQIKINMQNSTSNTQGKIYFITNTDTVYNDLKSVNFTITANDSGFIEDSINMIQNANWNGIIKQIRIVPFGSVNGTLKIDYVKVVISPCTSQIITFNNIANKLISDPVFKLSASVKSGLPVEFKIISGPATIKGDSVFLKGLPGFVEVAADQSGDPANCIADEVKQTFIVLDTASTKPILPSNAYSNNWVATDAIGRTLPSYKDCGNLHSDKYVGVFYWLWHASVRVFSGQIKTVQDLLKENPNSPAFTCKDWYWGEPENGFYHPSDPWSTRRNLQMLANAGVDFIFFDFTNGSQGCNSLAGFMSVALDMKSKGIPVPKIAFFLNENYDDAFNCMLDNIYNKPEYDSLLFKWEGKPLIMADSSKCESECTRCTNKNIRDYFTWRKTWAFNSGEWNFLDHYPQTYYSENSKPEQIPVSKSLGAPLNQGIGQGASYHAGKAPTYDQYWETDQTQYGYFFEEQWSRAHAINPSIVCVTGWNELVAGAWPTYTGADVNSFMNKAWNDPSWRCVDPASCIAKDKYGQHIVPHGWEFIDEFNKKNKLVNRKQNT